MTPGATRVPAGVTAAASILIALLVCSLAPGLLEPADPGTIHATSVLVGPSATYPLGTDALGRDVLSRMIDGAGGTVVGPLVLAVATLALGVPLALLAGFRGGATDATISRIVDVVYALPALLIAIVVVGVFGGGIWIAVAALTVLHVPQTVRLFRAALLQRRRLPYVEAAEVLGVPPWRIMGRHLLAPMLPLVRAVLFVRLTYGLVELSSLSFLGFGATPGSTNWGRMLAENRGLISVNPWAALAPGLALILVAVSFNLLGDWAGERDGTRVRATGREGPGTRRGRAGRRARTDGRAETPASGRERGPGLSVADLRIASWERGRSVEIAAEVALTVRPGEAVGLVGESGSGKSLTALALLGLLPTGVRSTGALALNGVDIRRSPEGVRGGGVSLLLQDPGTMLNPLERCGAQVLAGLRDERGHRLGARARRGLAAERFAEVGLPDALVDRYPFELSGGERQRVAIAAAIARRPAVLIADEPTSALDASARSELLELLDRLRRERQLGLLLITHNLGLAFSVCDRVHVMYAGRIVESAPSAALVSSPRHPYSLGLLLAEPPADQRVSPLGAIPGTMPAPGSRSPGCDFAPRCRWAAPRCTAARPVPAEVAVGHLTRCVRIAEIGPELDRVRRRPRGSASESSVERRETLARVRGLTVAFAGRRPSVALDRVDLDLPAGAGIGLIGDSGAGKTTLARCLVGLIIPGSGMVEVGGIELPATTRSDRESLRRTAQMVFQDPAGSLNPALSVGSTLREALALGGGGAEAEVSALLGRVGLPAAYAGRRPAALSGGERQRVAIARALARRPRLLICDEVVSGLDVSTQAQILELLRELHASLSLTLLFISHDLAVVRQITDELCVLADGRVVETGRTEAVLDAPVHAVTRRLLADSRPRT
jgi:peptide/nickel transport system ATP-binding protein